jgi:hypothetical protein
MLLSRSRLVCSQGGLGFALKLTIVNNFPPKFH